jgi:uncharacterized protein YukJ
MINKAKYKKNQRVYFMVDNNIQYGKVTNILSDYTYELKYHDPDAWDTVTKSSILTIHLSEELLFFDKKSLIKNLLKHSEEIDKYFEKEIRRKKSIIVEINNNMTEQQNNSKQKKLFTK